ncbi:hypothetical protein NQZ68_027299 [Dissostichus eleginoides]|nr:hypothetical protein NQZ68_027299 [Dissostichus eleginoides]
MAESAITFEGWRYAHYFEFVRRIDRNVTVRCKLCPGQKLLSTAVNTTSNLNKHLQRTHAKVKLIAKDPRTQSEDVVSAPPPTPKQQKFEFGGPFVISVQKGARSSAFNTSARVLCSASLHRPG